MSISLNQNLFVAYRCYQKQKNSSTLNGALRILEDYSNSFYEEVINYFILSTVVYCCSLVCVAHFLNKVFDFCPSWFKMIF